MARTRRTLVLCLVIAAHALVLALWNVPVPDSRQGPKGKGGKTEEQAKSEKNQKSDQARQTKQQDGRTKMRLAVHDAKSEKPQSSKPKAVKAVAAVKKQTARKAEPAKPQKAEAKTSRPKVEPQPKPAEPLATTETAKPKPEPKVKDAQTLARYRKEMAERYKFQKGERVSELLLSSSDIDSHQRGLAYFGFRWVARIRPSARVSKPFYIVRSGAQLIRQDGRCPYSGWSMGDLPYNDAVRDRAVTVAGLSQADLEFFYASTESRAEAYLRGKQRKAIHELGLRPDQVREVLGLMKETSFGGYVLVIEKLLTSDGRVVAYDDPDLREVSLKS